MIYVYAPSMSIITYVAKRWIWTDITIVTPSEEIEKFCLKAKISYIKINYNNNKSFKDLIEFKKYIIKTAQKFSNCTFIFGHNSHDYWGLFFINQLTKNKNKIFYNSQHKEHLKCSLKHGILAKKYRRLLLDNLIIWFITKYRFDVLSLGEFYFIGVDVQRIMKKFAKNPTSINDKIFESNQQQVLLEYKISDVKIILIDQGEAFYKFTNELLDSLVLLSKKYNCFYLKQHPTFKTTNSKLLNSLQQIPSEIPAEFVITKKTVVLGIASTTMNHVNECVSLLKLIEPKKGIIKDKYYNLLDHSKVFYPKTIKELEFYFENMLDY